MSARRLVFLYAEEPDRLRYPPDCPFKTERAGLTRRRLRSLGLLGTPDRREAVPRRARRAELEAVHSPRYLEELQRAAAGELTLDGLSMGLGGPDTPVFADLFEYGAWACGAGLVGAELLLAGEADVVFNLWGGFHHAMRERAAGFCYLNDVALACHHLAAAGRRVAYVDVDAHHGDGVQAAFYRRPDVLTISLHESGKTLFPWGGFEDEIGEGPGRGYNVNLPLPAGTYDAAFLDAFEEAVLPLLRTFAPQVVVVELGMDALAGDPLTHLALTNNAHARVLEHLLGLGAPLLVAGGGGYHVENTVRGWARAWQVCAGADAEPDVLAGLGGVMLGSTEWAGGLRDPERPVSAEQRRAVDTPLRASIDAIRRNVFPLHGLPPAAVAPRGPALVAP
jgi:acetoin utilization protein AcuC